MIERMDGRGLDVDATVCIDVDATVCICICTCRGGNSRYEAAGGEEAIPTSTENC